MADIDLQPALDIDDVATHFKVNRRTVWLMITDGRLPAVRVGRVWRVRPQDCADYLAGKPFRRR